MFWVGAAIVGIVLATAVLYYIRRMAVSKEGRTRPGISVEAVEELHSQGLLSDEEYKRARRAALGLPSKSEVAGGSGEAENPARQGQAGSGEPEPGQSDDPKA